MSSNNQDYFKTAGFLLMSGAAIFHSSLKSFKLRRRMADIPKSKIASAAIGRNVEIHGTVLCHIGEEIISPLSSHKTAAYIWDFQEYVHRNKSSYWQTKKMFYSSPFLYVTDDSQAIAAIDLASCEFQESIFCDGVKFNDNSFDISEGVKAILSETSMLDVTDKSTFFSTKYRIREALLPPGSSIYILGAGHIPPTVEKTLVKENHVFGTPKLTLKARIAEAFQLQLKNSKTISQFDKNGDGALDQSEQEAVYQALEKKALSISDSQKKNGYLSQSRILMSLDQGADGFIKLDKVYVSKSPENSMSLKLAGKAYLGMICGPALIVIGLLMFFYH